MIDFLIRVAERPWSDAMDWSTLAHQVTEYNSIEAKHQSHRLESMVLSNYPPG